MCLDTARRRAANVRRARALRTGEGLRAAGERRRPRREWIYLYKGSPLAAERGLALGGKASSRPPGGAKPFGKRGLVKASGVLAERKTTPGWQKSSAARASDR